ncbi:MAG: DUF2171 domain-containing protein [Caldilineaceae bacterium]
MLKVANIREHMEVVGSDGKHVGAVDGIESDRIKLIKRDATARGEHHYISFDSIERVEDSRVLLKETAQAAMQAW